MALEKLKGIFGGGEEQKEFDDEILENLEGKDNTVILLEPRAYSEAQQIATYLKQRSSVVVNLKRVTPDIGKRIVDYLGGVIFAISGDIQKLGGGIFLCTPSTVSVEGKISDDLASGKGQKSKKGDDSEEEDFNW